MTDKPYDEYVDRALSGLKESVYTCDYEIDGVTVREDPCVDISVRGLRQLLTDAWLAGLAYSLDLIEEETKSPLRVRLRDMPKKFEGGGRMKEPFLWEKCE